MNEGGVGAAGARTAPDIHENQEALSVARALTGYRAAVEALVPAPDHWRAARAGAPGYWDNTPKTVAEATACNQDALRWHGVPEGVWPTDADGRFGLWGGRDFRESDSEPEESDSDDSE